MDRAAEEAHADGPSHREATVAPAPLRYQLSEADPSSFIIRVVIC